MSTTSIKDQRGKLKTNRIPVKVIPQTGPLPRKPEWIRAKAPTDSNVVRLKTLLREQSLHTVCEEAACPNLGECFAKGTATFMIMGDLCTRRCPFCDVAHGRPKPLDEQEPLRLAETIAKMQLRYVVITSVDRDDLKDGGGEHFRQCIQAIRERTPEVKIEILVPDFRGRVETAIQVRPGADYQGSLKLLQSFKQQSPETRTKSGLMLGLGEEIAQVKQVLQDLREHDCDMLTLGQYLQPSRYHLPVQRFVHPDEFDELGEYATELGFHNVASGPMVRSSYHADLQASGNAAVGKVKI